MYQLVIEDDEGKTTSVPLPNSRDEITIGRKEGNTIRLTERNVSRVHARIVRSNGSYFIEDKGSYNGVKVNGDRISGRRHLKEGDRVSLGDYKISLKFDKDKEMETPPARAMEPPEKKARFCLISGPLAGKIFTLRGEETLIGRTEENDIILSHPSISRNHAKVLLEKDTYKIVDLGSANGVRVNGEEYGKVALKSGDKVDLGHVRLRFIAPGEQFTYDPSMLEFPEKEDEPMEDGEDGPLKRWWRSLRSRK